MTKICFRAEKRDGQTERLQTDNAKTISPLKSFGEDKKFLTANQTLRLTENLSPQ